ncbi:hypothetical protein AVEN_258171-1 [Araneus ventricosus]|uniref:Uncharacterized protein n=1 Tax=Araneus ventricosus TaxID=182803 RepID=A0A4Y2GGW5_ARAVE|nr:hypothetical protein AVEN_258171-1 [Araneus ventricosus]
MESPGRGRSDSDHKHQFFRKHSFMDLINTRLQEVTIPIRWRRCRRKTRLVPGLLFWDGRGRFLCVYLRDSHLRQSDWVELR